MIIENKKITVDIILVSYNTTNYIIKAIQSVLTETKKTTFNIIVVDNASPDGSSEKIKTTFPNITFIQSDKNLGFAGGVNLGVKNSTADYILMLNPDTIVLDSAIDKLITFAEENSYNGIWGGLTLNNDLSINNNNAWAKPDISTLFFSAVGLTKVFNTSCFFNKANYGCWQRNSIKAVDIIQGSFFLTSGHLWKKLNGLDETFFMYAEEADYCFRAKKLGYQPLITPNAKIIHHGGVSENNISGKMIKLLTGKSTLFNKHSVIWLRLIYKSLLVFYVFNKWLIFKIKNKQDIAEEWKKVLLKTPKWIQGYH